MVHIARAEWDFWRRDGLVLTSATPPDVQAAIIGTAVTVFDAVWLSRLPFLLLCSPALQTRCGKPCMQLAPVAPRPRATPPIVHGAVSRHVRVRAVTGVRAPLADPAPPSSLV